MSLDFIPALQAGSIEALPGIARFDGPVVSFTDDTQLEVDVILYATGYQLSFPFLSPETLEGEATELELYQRIAHPTHEHLFFVGCCRAMCSMWPLAEQQSRWIAKLLSGAFQLPPANKRHHRAVPLAAALPVICSLYVEQLRREARGF